MIEGLENQQQAEDRAVNRADVRASAAFAAGGGVLSAMRSGNSAQVPSPGGQLVPNPGGLNGALPADDPDYDPILDQLPGVFVSYFIIGQALGLSPLKP